MNFLNIFEDRVAGIFGAARAPFSFKKLAKQAAREMEDQTLVVDGVDTAPALFTILISSEDEPLLSSYYTQLAREVSEFVKAQAEKKRYIFVGEPLIRFMTDPALKGGKFSVFAENVDAPTLGRLYEEERAYRNGLSRMGSPVSRAAAQQSVAPQAAQQPLRQPTPRAAVQQQSPSPRARVSQANAQPQTAAPRARAIDIPQVETDPFAAPQQAFPVPQTVSREALAGLGGAAAVGAAAAAGAGAASEGIASHMVNARNPQMAARPMAELVDVVTGESYQIDRAQCTIGRERASSDVALRDPNVSRRHAQLTFNGSDWTIEDLGSTNGTLVNNRRINRCPLRSGDLLTFGLSTFEFRG